MLFFALLFERKFFEPVEEVIEPILDVLIVILFFWGEIAALWALLAKADSSSARALVITPMLLAGLGLVAPVTGPRLATARHTTRAERRWVNYGYAIVVAAALYAPPIIIIGWLWARALV